MGRDYSERQLTELVGLLRRRSAPGHKFEYSNSGYLLLGADMIRMIAGQFHADYIRKNIFEPLGMKTAVLRATRTSSSIALTAIA